ncbi:Plasmodium exported protein, unknown function [Plasmodium relictum]|uniref:Plasmodium RESA N-terminal domain-containing protein n=1 Tax=Plasmodium relictum TaxID=85471 RepID=A0A1J1GKV3_PLARL|nr:Plasmodium exported protein, unknown function [Plasmodium relictum]CRG85765.1 Plasmodium exported protein, unknown function [Plasmodium relictum]
MIFFKGLIDNLNKWFLALCNILTKKYFTYLHINRREIIKKRNYKISVHFKLFIILFLTFLTFLLECLIKQRNLLISSLRFNENHLRLLAEKEQDDMNKHIHIDKSWEKYNKYFKDTKLALIEYMLYNWEIRCKYYDVRCTIDGRVWEQEKFKDFYDKLCEDMESIQTMVTEEYEKLKKSSLKDKKLSEFFKKKRKELNKFKDKTKRHWSKNYLKEFKLKYVRYNNKGRNPYSYNKNKYSGINLWLCSDAAFFLIMKSSLLDYILEKWEDYCYYRPIRYTLDGKMWEEEKFKYWYDKLHKDIENMNAMILEEQEKFMEGSHTYEEFINFFKSKKMKCMKFRESIYDWSIQYLNDFKKEWKQLKDKK